MDDLRALYGDVVRDHGRAPRNFGPLAGATHTADGENPLCGDRVRVALVLDGDVVRAAGFEGAGCTLTLASASLMTEALAGRTVAAARALADRIDGLCDDRAPDPAPAVSSLRPAPRAGAAPSPGDLGALAALAAVRRYPARVRCATLPWHALRRALAVSHGT